MKRKRIMAIMLCVLLLIPAALQTFAESGSSPFSDVRGNEWFADVVEQAYERGIVNGYPDGSFKPEKEVSYAEFLAMSMRLEKISKPENPAHWAECYYASALSRGIIGATDFTLQDLDKTIPRRHMALILAGLINARGKSYPDGAQSFSDISGIGCGREIMLCAAAGVLSGYPDGSFRPEGSLTRSEAVTAVMNYLKLLDSELITGGEVAEIYDSGSMLIRYDDGSYEMYFGHDSYMAVDPPDPNEELHALSLMREDHREILDRVLASAKISGTAGNYTFTYTQPQIPDRYHFAADLHIYRGNAEESEPVFFNNSDAGWMTHRENYDPSAKTVTMKLDGVSGLDGKSVILKLQIYDILDEYTLEYGEGATYVYSTDFDGSFKRVCHAARYHDGEIKDYESFDDARCPAFCWQNGGAE